MDKEPVRRKVQELIVRALRGTYRVNNQTWSTNSVREFDEGTYRESTDTSKMLSPMGTPQASSMKDTPACVQRKNQRDVLHSMPVDAPTKQ